MLALDLLNLLGLIPVPLVFGTGTSWMNQPCGFLMNVERPLPIRGLSQSLIRFLSARQGQSVQRTEMLYRHQSSLF